jgi:peptidoglycan hydrolase CwlO-like protein
VARVVAFVCAAVLLTALTVGPVRADTQAELDAAVAKLNKLVDQIAGETKTVATLQGEANALAQKMNDVQTQIALTQGKIVGLQQDIRQATNELRATQAQLDDRARLAYETGPGSSIDFILGSRSLTDLNDRLEIVDSAAQTDEDLINAIAAKRANLKAKQDSLGQLEVQQMQQRATLQVQQADLNDKLTAEQSVLNKLTQDKADADALVKKLKTQRAKEIAAEKARLAAIAASQHSGGPAIGGVLLVCPVDPPHAYSDDFGAPRYAGGFHLHAGNDILAPRGTPIRAPFPGTATDASNGLGGLSVEVTGAAGYVYNAHLSRFGTLGSVNTGTIIGYVGDSGDAQGGPTHDHFEWHPNVIPSNLHVSPYGVSIVGTAIDPYPYLNSAC